MRREMEASSALFCKGCAAWQGLLLTGRGNNSLTVGVEGNSEAEWSALKRTGARDETWGFCLPLWGRRDNEGQRLSSQKLSAKQEVMRKEEKPQTLHISITVAIIF